MAYGLHMQGWEWKIISRLIPRPKRILPTRIAFLEKDGNPSVDR